MGSEMPHSIRYTAIATLLPAVIAASFLSGLYGCASPKRQLMKMDIGQLNLRSMQSRVFDTTDKKKTLRSVISTLQDFDFLIDEADRVLGLVSATRPSDSLQIAVTVRPDGESQMLVRANIEFNNEGVIDPSVFQKFFSVLEKSMFLTAHEVD